MNEELTSTVEMDLKVPEENGEKKSLEDSFVPTEESKETVDEKNEEIKQIEKEQSEANKDAITNGTNSTDDIPKTKKIKADKEEEEDTETTQTITEEPSKDVEETNFVQDNLAIILIGVALVAAIAVKFFVSKKKNK